jgi:hypothetical protein
MEKQMNHSGRHSGGCRMLGPMKEARRKGRRFSSDEDITGVVQIWLKTQRNNFFYDGIKKHVKRWNRCVEVEGECVEK